MKFIDMRSDTVTQPTQAMRRAMAEAEVGDDVYGEDPTVRRLEEEAAARLGKEAGLLVPSGTMGNLAALLAHCGRGDQVVLGDRSHTFRFEQGGLAALGGIMPCLIPNGPQGTLDLADIRRSFREENVHYPRTRLVCLENTHNVCDGTPLTADTTDRVAALVHELGGRLHIDGARIFNAAVALAVDPKELVRGADSVTFCLSKGLCAPVGSVLCGSRPFIHEARRARKVLGGGMRQAGVLAAAGLVALTMVDRLAEDHTRAQRLAQALTKLPGVTVAPVTTNIVYFAVDRDHDEVASALRDRGTLLLGKENGRFRAVTHHDIDDEALDRAIVALKGVLGA